MDIEVVSVARKRQPMSRTAAAIYVITAEDIRRSGARSIPELLRMVPGLHVARIDSSQWAISTRGSNSQFFNRMLVMVDGRALSTSIYGGVYWDAQDLLLEDIDRIEVIRGPSATTWGPRAANGVVNIIMKKASETQGGYTEAGGGGQERAFGAMRYGGRWGANAHYRVTGQFARHHHSEREDGTDGADGLNTERAGFQLDWNAAGRNEVSLRGNTYQLRTGQNAGVPEPQAVVTNAAVNSTGRGGDSRVRWLRTSGDGTRTDVQFSHDWVSNNGWRFEETTHNIDFDLRRLPRPYGRHELLYGFNYVETRNGLVDRAAPTPASMHRVVRRSSLFLTDEWSLASNLHLSMGARVEHNSYTGVEVQPEVRLSWEPRRGETFWAAVARGVRPPTPVEADARGEVGEVIGVGGMTATVYLASNPEIRSEVVRAVEGGYRTELSSKWSVDVAGYWNAYSRLRGVELAPPPPGIPPRLEVRFNDGDRGRAVGLESSVEWKPRHYWRLAASHTWTRLTLNPGGPSLPVWDGGSGSVPSHEGQIRSYLTLPRKVTFDTSLYVTGELTKFALPTHARLDARLGWNPSRHLELSVTGTELQGGRHLEFYSEFFGRPGVFGRSFHGRIAWRF